MTRWTILAALLGLGSIGGVLAVLEWWTRRRSYRYGPNDHVSEGWVKSHLRETWDQ